MYYRILINFKLFTMQNNKISVSISAADKKSVLDKITALQTQLKPVLLFNLSPSDRMSLVKMGDKTLTFVDKALTYAAQNPATSPSYLDLAEANKDFALANDLAEIHKKLSTLLVAIEDNLMLAGSEAYESALVYYNAVKGARRSNVPGVENIHADLANHFPRKRSTKEANAAS